MRPYVLGAAQFESALAKAAALRNEHDVGGHAPRYTGSVGSEG
jgi:hypothetical protein